MKKIIFVVVLLSILASCAKKESSGERNNKPKAEVKKTESSQVKAISLIKTQFPESQVYAMENKGEYIVIQGDKVYWVSASGCGCFSDKVEIHNYKLLPKY